MCNNIIFISSPRVESLLTPRVSYHLSLLTYMCTSKMIFYLCVRILHVHSIYYTIPVELVVVGGIRLVFFSVKEVCFISNVPCNLYFSFLVQIRISSREAFHIVNAKM